MVVLVLPVSLRLPELVTAVLAVCLPAPLGVVVAVAAVAVAAVAVVAVVGFVDVGSGLIAARTLLDRIETLDPPLEVYFLRMELNFAVSVAYQESTEGFFFPVGEWAIRIDRRSKLAPGSRPASIEGC